MISARRRVLVLWGAGLLASPALRAQHIAQFRSLALLMGTANDRFGNAQLDAFRGSLHELGWTQSQNLRMEHRWGEGNSALMRKHAEELAHGKPDIFVTQTATALREVQRAAGPLPIVFWGVSDPVGNKFVQSHARPGANVTGFSLYDYEMGPKWLVLLKEAAPRLTRVLVLMNTTNPNWRGWLRALDPVAPSLGLQLIPAELRAAADIEPSVSSFANNSGGALLVLPDPFTSQHRDLILKLAHERKLPAVYGSATFAEKGGLIYYGINQVELAKRAASYASRILKGEKPRDLPVQRPEKFELRVNLNTAKALGLTLPQSLLLRADQIVG